MNALRHVSCLFLEAIDAALCSAFLLYGLTLIGQLVKRIPLHFVGSLVPRGVASPLLQNTWVGFVVVLIGGLLIVAAMLRRELHEEADQNWPTGLTFRTHPADHLAAENRVLVQVVADHHRKHEPDPDQHERQGQGV
jgi:hypothetical protein